MNFTSKQSRSDSDNKLVSTQLKIAKEKEATIDRLSDRLSDWFSPILVKETRQALKSRQFFWTFFLVLSAVVIWTLIGLTINDATLEFGNAGPLLLSGYWIILGFPLAIVIPYGANRSLAREFEDGTIQLVSVTTMKAWQIVAGKLGSSMLQMLIYVSVLAPCIAFTYLLRGISIPQIVVGMLFSISGCFGLSCIALFFAGSARSKVISVGVSILLILLQFFTYIFWMIVCGSLAFGELAFLARDEGMFVTSGVIALFVSTGLLMFSAATGLISFDSDNRSTLTRIMMVVQQTLFIGWCISLMCYVLDPVQVVIFSFVVAHYWLVMGWILIGEDTKLSVRVRRSIPQSWLTKTMFSLFLPGSGRGLTFACVNIWFCGFVFFAVILLGPGWLPESIENSLLFSNGQAGMLPGRVHQYLAGTTSVCLYATFFLSVVYLFCAWSRKRRIIVNGIFSLASGFLLVAILTGAALLFHFNFYRYSQRNDYSFIQVFNWYWTSIELSDNGFANAEIMFFVPIAFVAMLIVSMIALFHASRELLQSKAATPERVELETLAARQVHKLPKGESIEEILGELE